MSEVRLAKQGETNSQKEIWKLCFGDSDSYINFYYANRYKEDDTLVLLHGNEIIAMLTIIPVKTITPLNQEFNTAMLYAIATHPKYQNRGFATQLMDFCNHYIRAKHIDISILVPANKQLFGFYRKQGYQDGFYIRETHCTRDSIDCLPPCKSTRYKIFSITPEQYNQRRNHQLNGNFYIAYSDRDIVYQKMISRLSGADIYGIDSEDIQGCVAIERLNLDKVLIKEILLPEKFINGAIKEIAKQLYAKEYELRTPANLGENLGGSIRSFGMIRGHKEINLKITPEALGYLGFAFD